MSTKQSVIFAFMVVFLCVMLTTLGMWFYYSLELNIKERAVESLKLRRSEIKRQKEALDPIIGHPQTGLNVQLEEWTGKASTKQQEAYDADDAPYKRWQEKEGELKTYWDENGEVAKAWRTTYEEWTKRNLKIKAQADDLKQQTVTAQQKSEQAQKELEEVLKKEEGERKGHTVEMKQKREDLEGIRKNSEEVQDKILKEIRTLTKSPAEELDGVVIHAAPDLKQVTVDLGSEHGAKTGLKFRIFDGRYKAPVYKGELVLAKVGATSALAIVLPATGRPKVDPATGWEAADPGMRYSPLSAAGPDGLEPQALEKPKTKKDLVEEILTNKRKQENPDAEEPLANVSAEPPVTISPGFNPIVAGDWIANQEFIRIVPNRAFNQQVREELASLRNINVGPLTFFMADTIRPYRREFLRRLCERNRCKAVPAVTPDVDIIVSTPDASSVEMLEDRLKLPSDKEQRQKVLKDKAAQSPDLANRAKTLEALEEGRRIGAQVMSEDELENFFVKRQRKVELAKGSAIQPGQHVFFVVGETQLRSNLETGQYIQEHGGIMAQRLDAGVDYLVAGAGLTDAKMDKGTGRIYYAKEQAPPQALPFFDVVRTLGLKIIREEELAHFFGLQ